MVLHPAYKTINNCFNTVEHAFEGLKGQRYVSTLLVLIFIGGLLSIQANLFGWLPAQIAVHTPTNHLKAIELVFTIVLAWEAVGLIFSLAHSVSISVGKQVEILSLVLLRNIFKQISHMQEPIIWEEVSAIILNIAALAFASLIIFIILHFYYRQIEPKNFIDDDHETKRFIITKKLIALLLMVTFVIILVGNWWNSLFFHQVDRTFETFFTLLIFSDILIMLISMRYRSCYRVAFRNSGFAVATLMIRIALITPPIYSAAIGVASALFILGIRFAYTHYIPSGYQQRREDMRRKNCHK
ncbi:MAG: hypothetical protein B6I36_00020 [Desulfobacteraceae bacterium 4572_35.1]|nr:MAG: hypothetical protein B6I36_00020 [Desulfobacteraceae bacterium 4572_35.1]